MAQGSITFDGMLSRGGRESPQCAVRVTPDGKYSCRNPVAEKARELKDKDTHIFMAPLPGLQGRELQTLKRCTSQS